MRSTWTSGIVTLTGLLAVLLAAAPIPGRSATINLSGVYELALTRDAGFLAAAAANRAALERPAQARAELLPVINSHLDLSVDDGNDYGNVIRLELDQPIYRGALRIALGQADLLVQEAHLRYASARQDLMVRTSQAYFGVLRAAEELSFARATEEAFGQQLEQSRQRFEVGLIAATDVEEAKAGFDRARAEVIAAGNDLDTAREALREVTGEYHHGLARLGRDLPLVVPEPADIDQWTELGLRQNLDVGAAELASRYARDDIRRREAGRLPTVDLGAKYTRNSGARFHALHADGSSGLVEVKIRLPLFQGGRVLSSTREGLHLHQQALEEYEAAKRSAQRQTREAFLGVKSGISRVEALSQAVRSATSAKEAIEAGFQVGTRTSVDVLNAERDLFGARRDHAVARYDYILNVLRLKRSAGTLSEDDLATINAWLE